MADAHPAPSTTANNTATGSTSQNAATQAAPPSMPNTTVEDSDIQVEVTNLEKRLQKLKNQILGKSSVCHHCKLNPLIAILYRVS
jgi:hypothetical protein